MALTPSGGGKSGFLVKPLCPVLGERTSLCCHFLLAIGGCCFQLNSCSSYCRAAICLPGTIAAKKDGGKEFLASRL